MSQLGMMVVAIGLSSYAIALFHLINHAFYKGLLFLAAGAVIHGVADNQDFRKYGGLKNYLPLSYSVMLIASLSLVAFPFMTGFYSKDFILESAYGLFSIHGTVIYYIATTGAMFTTLYSVKVLHLTFLANPNGPRINYNPVLINEEYSKETKMDNKMYSDAKKVANEGDIYISMPLIILALFSIFFGYLTKDIFIGLGSNFFSDNSLFIHPIHEIMLETEFFVPIFYKLAPFVLTITLVFLYLLISEGFPNMIIRFKLSIFGYTVYSFLNQRFAVEMFYNKYISGVVLKLGGQTSKYMDKGIIEKFGPYGLQEKCLNISKSINNLSTGVVTYYALYILVALIVYINISYIIGGKIDILYNMGFVYFTLLMLI
jgi:NADH-ubiquinone oxidoreductase chain 5